MICDVIGIAQFLSKIQMAAMYFVAVSIFKAFLIDLHFKTLETTKTDLVTLISLNRLKCYS